MKFVLTVLVLAALGVAGLVVGQRYGADPYLWWGAIIAGGICFVVLLEELAHWKFNFVTGVVAGITMFSSMVCLGWFSTTHHITFLPVFFK